MSTHNEKNYDDAVCFNINRATKERLRAACEASGAIMSDVMRYGTALAIEAIESGRYYRDQMKALKKRHMTK